MTTGMHAYPHMFVEAGGLTETLGTHVTLVWSVLLVHVEDMDT